MPFSRPIQQKAAFFLFAGLWIMFAWVTGIFKGGFQFYDDIIYAELYTKLQHGSFLHVLSDIIKNDLAIRFRPVALFHYLFVAQIFHLDYTAIILYNVIITILSCYFLHRFISACGFGFVKSILFVGILYLGNQGSIAMRTVLSENIAMLFLSLSLFYLKERKILSTLFFLLAACTKESFLLLSPAIIMTDRIISDEVDLNSYLRKNFVWVISITILSILVALIIILKVGTHSVGYAGIDADTLSLKKLADVTFRLFISKGYLIPVIIGLIIIYSRKSISQFPVKRSVFILAALVAIPQVILFAKSGIFMHYLLPGMFWSAISVIAIWKYLLSNHYPLSLQLIFRSSMLLLLAFNTYLLARNTIGIAREGRSNRQAMELIRAHTQPADTILIIAHPLWDYEKGPNVSGYLNSYLYERKNVILLPSTQTSELLNKQQTDLFNEFIRRNAVDPQRKVQLINSSKVILFMGSRDYSRDIYPDQLLQDFQFVNEGSFKTGWKKH